MNNVHTSLPALQTGQRPVWLFWDLYKTLCRATYPEPIKEFQQILGYKAERGLVSPDPDFLRICLTTASRRVREEFHQNRRIVEENPGEFIHLVATQLGLEVPHGAEEAFRDLIRREKNGLCLFLDVKEELKQLKAMGYKNALLSNTWQFPIPKLFENPNQGFALDDFDELVMSYEVGVAKPNREFFLEAAQRCRAHVGDCLMIGDNPEFDVQAALDVGMRAVHIDRYGDCATRIPGVPVIEEIRQLYATSEITGQTLKTEMR